MKILITGNMGYIGPVLYDELHRSLPDAELIGFDSGFFAHCLTNASYLPECKVDKQYFGDLRAFPYQILDDIDVVIHLAAISNDPMGNEYEAVTEAINDKASKAIAREARQRGVRAFVFASSCSMYGQATGDARKETDTLNPLTAYARSKVSMEHALENLADDNFVVTSLRFSTACGMSPRLRLDLVINDFVAGAITSGKVTVLSDGTPWRPLIHIKDMSRSMAWAVGRSAVHGGDFLAINVGSAEWNYQVKDLANAVAAAIPGTEVFINTDAQPDKRSYRVDFSFYRKMAPEHQPLMSLESTILELRDGLVAMRFTDENFRQSQFMRLKVLEKHVQQSTLSKDLRWTIT